MTERITVLITGAAGRIGGLIRHHLGTRYTLRALDRTEVADVPCTVANIADLDAIRPAFEGIDVVVHLAANPWPRASWESVLRSNIIGTRNVFEAAREAGVRRVVYASSHHAAGFFGLKDDPYKAIYDGRLESVRHPFPRLSTDLVRPDSYYGVSKAFGEALGSYFHDQYGMSVICLRIGWVMEPDDPTFSSASLSLWLSQRDAVQLLAKSIEAPRSVGFAIVNGESDNTLGIWDLEAGRNILGFEPQDDGGDQWTSRPDSPPVI
jgi:nucleoside-diphosphate-sugar epimerase